jgi:hypothetical protein
MSEDWPASSVQDGRQSRKPRRPLGGRYSHSAPPGNQTVVRWMLDMRAANMRPSLKPVQGRRTAAGFAVCLSAEARQPA